MANYKLRESAKEDLIRIYLYGVEQFGEKQAEKYYNKLFDHFDKIALSPFSFESVNHIKEGYHRSVCGVDSMYYRIEKDYIDIIAIIGRQDFA